MTVPKIKRTNLEAGLASYITTPRSQAPVAERGGASDSFMAYALDQHAIVSVANLQGEITYVNDKFVEISGYLREELIGQNHRLLKSDEHPPEFFRALWRTIAQGKTWSGEIKNLTKDGAPYWVMATMVPLLDGNGKPIEYLSIRTDITSVKSQEALKQQQISFDLVRGEVYMFWPGTLRYFYLNKDARKRCSRAGMDPSRLTVMEFMSDVPEAELRRWLHRLETKQEQIFSYFTDLTRGNGSVFPAEIIVQYVEPKGERPRFVAVVRDITERKQAEKAKTEFVATVSHELRTPLTSIKGALSLIKAASERGIPGKTDKLIDIAIKSSTRLETLIKDLLAFEEMETGKLSCRLEQVDIARILQESVNEFSASHHSNRIQLHCFGTDTPVPVVGDHDRLLQVMANLLSNAAKFSDPDAPVEVRLTTDAGNAYVSVRDFGAGIPEHVVGTIFDTFTQADSSDHRKAGGVGLGLSLAKAIIDDHGGRIDLESELGKGATFRFSLKRCPDGMAADPA